MQSVVFERIILVSMVIVLAALLFSAKWVDPKPPEVDPPKFLDRQLLISVPEYNLDHIHDLHEDPIAYNRRLTSGIGAIKSGDGDVLFEKLTLVSEFVGSNAVGDFYSLELTVGETEGAATETIPLLVTDSPQEKIVLSAPRYQIKLLPPKKTD